MTPTEHKVLREQRKRRADSAWVRGKWCPKGYVTLTGGEAIDRGHGEEVTTGNRAEHRLRWTVWGEDVLSRDSTGRAEKEGEESPQEAVR